MKTVCFRVQLQKGAVEGAREWFRTMMERQEEVLESLRNEGAIVESVFLDRQKDGDFLIYYFKAHNVEKAQEIFSQSFLSIDVYHRSCWAKYCGEVTSLELLLDLDLIEKYGATKP